MAVHLTTVYFDLHAKGLSVLFGCKYDIATVVAPLEALPLYIASLFLSLLLVDL